MFQSFQVRLGPLEDLGGIIAQARGQGHARGGLVDLAGDTAGLTQPVPQQLVEFTEGQACLGNLELDLVAPVVLVGVGRTIRLGRRLHGLQLVLEAGCDDLAGEAVAGQVRRNRESADHQAMVLVRLPGHDGDGDHHRQPNRGGHRLQGQ